MSNESKPQEWFYLQNDTWNGPFKTSGLKELVKKGAVGPNTLLRLGVAGAPIKAHQIKSLFPNYQGEEQAVTSSIKNKSILNNVPALVAGAILIVSLIILFKLADGIASIEKEMVLIPAGRFMMGDRGDRLQVTLTKPFYMSKYEVTQEQYEAVMKKNPSTTNGAKLPVTDVSLEDCQEFIEKLNASTKGGYRLPYEAEWEYACRAGTSTAYSYGDNLTKSDANIDSDSIKAVGSYRPNAFGVYDMHGNVSEWCEDRYGSLQDGEVTDPKGPATGESRVLRGGTVKYVKSNARSSYRSSSAPAVRYYNTGFRLARTP